MRSTKIASLLLIFSAGMTSAFAQAGALSDETDRFTGDRVVRWNSLPSEPELFGVSSAAIYPKRSAIPLAYILSMVTWADHWQFLNCHRNNWLIDGSPAPELKFEYENSMGQSATIERFNLTAERSVLEKLASANLVEFSICGKEGKVSESDLAGIRKVLDVTR